MSTSQAMHVFWAFAVAAMLGLDRRVARAAEQDDLPLSEVSSVLALAAANLNTLLYVYPKAGSCAGSESILRDMDVAVLVNLRYPSIYGSAAKVPPPLQQARDSVLRGVGRLWAAHPDRKSIFPPDLIRFVDDACSELQCEKAPGWD